MLGMSTLAFAQKEKVLHSFENNGKDGSGPEASLVLDSAGNLYRTTADGGTSNDGTLFELARQTAGGWSGKILHSFSNNGVDGSKPVAALTLDSSGNLFGTTQAGGAYGDGAVFELSPRAEGGWGNRILHSFHNDGVDGWFPLGALILDASGNLYGTTQAGGSSDTGIVFELMPGTGGSYNEEILYSFGTGGDGEAPYAGLVFDGFGHLYGTTFAGGAHDFGTVFELSPKSGGGWQEETLHSFNFTSLDGANPRAGLVIDAMGNLYGTLMQGGAYGYGAVFELAPQSHGTWAEKLLFSFDLTGGSIPFGGLAFDAAGNLYGTTFNGGAYNAGLVFQLKPSVTGEWAETVLHNFTGPADGDGPYAGVTLDTKKRNLYGTTYIGGAYGQGSVFELAPY
jgi:uncharacterized repeat protein (TIGR03803 family)